MIRKLRVKFIINNMLIVGVMLSLMLGIIVAFTGRQLKEGTMGQLRNMDPNLIGHMPRSPVNSAPDELRLPIFAVRTAPDGTLTVVGDGYYDLSSNETLTEDLMERTEGMNEGVIEEYQLRYLRRGDTVLFADMSFETSAKASLTRNSLFVFLAAMVACFFISLAMANWATAPVEKAWNQQKQFVADASHDLRTPLTVIMTNAEMLPDSELSSGIRNMAHQMKGLVENLLELAKLDSPAENDTRSIFCLSDTVSEACMCYEVLFFEEGLTLQSSVTPGIHIRGNPDQINRLLSILLDNAKKYCDEKTETVVTLTGDGRNCTLSVADHGRPLSEEEMKNLFKRFYRGDTARGQNRSYGLGLSIAEGIVEGHKGKIWCESKEGINSFIVSLPMCSAPSG